MTSAPPGKPLPEKLSMEGVRFALQRGYIELVTFGVSQHRWKYHNLLFLKIMIWRCFRRPIVWDFMEQFLGFWSALDKVILLFGRSWTLLSSCYAHRLTYSEELGDLICSHGHDDLRVVDTCLALAQIVYSACGVLRKAVLSMCKRGLTGAALEFIYYNKEFTIGEKRSHSRSTHTHWL